MNLKTVLTPDTVNLHLKGTTKEAIIDELLDILVKAGKVKDKQAALACVLDRERKMSTGMKHGIAIPHGKTIPSTTSCLHGHLGEPGRFRFPRPGAVPHFSS
jgi:mannitol/fructose-specific phosphotransferase system IIA component (Ntr-type)